MCRHLTSCHDMDILPVDIRSGRGWRLDRSGEAAELTQRQLPPSRCHFLFLIGSCDLAQAGTPGAAGRRRARRRREALRGGDLR